MLSKERRSRDASNSICLPTGVSLVPRASWSIVLQKRMKHWKGDCASVPCLVLPTLPFLFYLLATEHRAHAPTRKDPWRLCASSVHRWRHQASTDRTNHGPGGASCVTLDSFFSPKAFFRTRAFSLSEQFWIKFRHSLNPFCCIIWRTRTSLSANPMQNWNQVRLDCSRFPFHFDR